MAKAGPSKNNPPSKTGKAPASKWIKVGKKKS